MDKLTIKNEEELKIMAEGGKKLREIREEVALKIKPGISGEELEAIANKLIEKSGGKASFKMVPGYHWATCINFNDVVVHGIPDKQEVRPGDKVSIDVGLYYKGFHTDTAVTVIAQDDRDDDRHQRLDKFLETGRKALKRAIEQAKPGKKVMDISKAIQDTVENDGYSPVTALTGHGVGKELHEQPAIPCFVWGKREHSIALKPGMVIAIEVMYNEGGPDVAYKNDDGWTIVTRDGKISGLFEHTVAIYPNGPVILT